MEIRRCWSLLGLLLVLVFPMPALAQDDPPDIDDYLEWSDSASTVFSIAAASGPESSGRELRQRIRSVRMGMVPFSIELAALDMEQALGTMPDPEVAQMSRAHSAMSLSLKLLSDWVDSGEEHFREAFGHALQSWRVLDRQLRNGR